MKDPQTFPFDVSRRYVLDAKPWLPSDVYDTVLGWIRARNIKMLASCPDHFPNAYLSLDLNIFTRQVAAFFKKNEALDVGVDLDSAAESAFSRAETICGITNKRLDYYFQHTDRISPELYEDIVRAQSIIYDLCGCWGGFLEDLPQRIRVTSGATATRSRRESLPHLKVRFRNMTITKSALPYGDALASYWGYKGCRFKVIDFNRVTTVPKNWKTNRTIACEPEVNLSLQLAFDEYMKTRLRSIGVDLSDQFRNQKLAKQGSIDDTLSTIDLAMASDTVAFNTVAWLLPYDWFKFLRDIRSPHGVGFGKEFKFAKFSSMGNGATFALESLIFAAFVKATGAKQFAVYGDDIIVPRSEEPRLLALLKFFGFQVNHEKSFHAGPFRESCGTDWFNGINTTPFYLRDANAKDCITCHNVNGLASIAVPEGHLQRFLRDLTLSEKLPLVPFNYSSISGVWVDIQTAYAQSLISYKTSGKGNQCLYFKGFVPKSKTSNARTSSSLFLWHLDATRQRAHFNDEEVNKPLDVKEAKEMMAIKRSKVPRLSFKYVRKWVHWNPVVGIPVHLYGWSDYILRES